jgi:pimeloyl-ACP methyl ester carboxylesterase
MVHCTRSAILAVVVAMPLVPLCSIAQPTETRTDSSPHTPQSVDVGDGVELEVLDWGGTRRALVLLAGLGNTAHVYDQFAPKLTDSNRVIGITRRGYGRSGAPSGGYDADGLADDVLAVLNTFNLDQPVLVGHSIASEEMSSLAARYPRRLGGLVYFDAAYDRTLPEFAAIQEIASRLGQLGEPTPADVAVMQGIRKPDYAAIRVPALSIYASQPASSRDLPGYSEDQAVAFEELHEALAELQMKSARAFREGIVNHRVVELSNANHYVFFSNEADVLREVRQFVSSLPQIGVTQP